ncbi:MULTISPECIES: transmembrane anchor protein [Qipengyuania]|uniref:transmembrane anchor protein n=1 Tax=Qipengyuania TaxID=1855416 RepID=UPI001C584664|nr:MULTISPECIES: transmembrane anchor protein [Qipengyuania]MEC9065870.1 transmembrane anchor protein [Pseudomonadota bacterium]MBW3169671.1 transmembrane anchor protein [Qipengyuania flava]MBY5966909.1 transmembrane anchor protein [Qipengyuania flava]MBY6013233.1 transmembrane anchor protein [Qipengyuania flava]MBY6027675.1 transmembrane anchor protein [Qipengyuania flava]
MFNSQRPSTSDLPTNRQLVKATAFALVTATVLLVTVVLPAEYAIDPTGAGRLLGYSEMGEIKQQLAAEAAADEQNAAVEEVRSLADNSGSGSEAATRSDVTELTLAPGEGAEVKAVMAEGASLQYEWSVQDGHVNFDTHADAPGISYHGYDKGRESTGEAGTLVAAFDGSHGWFWRNRSGATVTVTLKTDGSYSDIKRVV